MSCVLYHFFINCIQLKIWLRMYLKEIFLLSCRSWKVLRYKFERSFKNYWLINWRLELKKLFLRHLLYYVHTYVNVCGFVNFCQFTWIHKWSQLLKGQVSFTVSSIYIYYDVKWWLLRPEVFWCFQGVQKWNIGWKWFKCSHDLLLLKIMSENVLSSMWRNQK